MKTKKIIAGVLAFTIVFGTSGLPASVKEKAGISPAINADAAYNGELVQIGYTQLACSLNAGTLDIGVKTGEDEGWGTDIPSNYFTEFYAAELPFDLADVEHINIMDGVTSIGFEAFIGCTNLKYVDICYGDSELYIDSSAFADLPNLTDVYLNSRVTSIGDYAFMGCTALEAIYVPDSVTSIGKKAFGYADIATSVDSNFHIIASSGSAGETYATKNKTQLMLRSNPCETIYGTRFA